MSLINSKSPLREVPLYRLSITLLSCGLSCDCSVSAHETTVLASPVTTSLIPVSLAVDRELLKYLSTAIVGCF